VISKQLASLKRWTRKLGHLVGAVVNDCCRHACFTIALWWLGPCQPTGTRCLAMCHMSFLYFSLPLFPQWMNSILFDYGCVLLGRDYLAFSWRHLNHLQLNYTCWTIKTNMCTYSSLNHWFWLYIKNCVCRDWNLTSDTLKQLNLSKQTIFIYCYNDCSCQPLFSYIFCDKTKELTLLIYSNLMTSIALL